MVITVRELEPGMSIIEGTGYFQRSIPVKVVQHGACGMMMTHVNESMCYDSRAEIEVKKN